MPAYHPDYAVTEDSTWDGGGFSTNVVYSESNVSFSALQSDSHMQTWAVVLDWLPDATAATWQQFFRDRQGAYDPFYWFAWYRTSLVDGPVAIGDGSTVVFNVPYIGVSGIHPVIRVNGGAVAEGVDYNYNYIGGTAGEDMIQFFTPPALNDIITSSESSYRHRHLVRFKADSFLQTKFRYQDGGIAAQFSYQLEEVVTGA